MNLRFEVLPYSKWSSSFVQIWSNLLFESIIHFPLCLASININILKIVTKFCIVIFLMLNILLHLLIWLCDHLTLLSRVVKANPGRKTNYSEYLSICPWHLNSVFAYDYFKLFLLKAYNLAPKFDIICLSETYLDSIVPLDNDNLEIPGHTLVRSYHPCNTKGKVSACTTKTIYH